MNTIKLLILFSVFALASCHAQDSTSTRATPVAEVELFTSEGCSSCPPADRLLARYAEDALHDGVRVFPLAFHVDYWDYLGWKDAFSAAAYSDRQRMYVEALHLNGAYTPQMVVNGSEQFVGSDEEALRKALHTVAKATPIATFTKLTCTKEAGGSKINYALGGDSRDCEINIALVSAHESTAVKRGENRGRQLDHSNVVKEFMTVKASSNGEIAVPFSLHGANDSYIVYLQNKSSKKIIAAMKLNN